MEIEKILSGRDLLLYRKLERICVNKYLDENLDEEEKEAYEHMAQALTDDIDKEILENIKKYGGKKLWNIDRVLWVTVQHVHLW